MIVMFPALVIGAGSSEPQSLSDDSPELLSSTWVLIAISVLFGIVKFYNSQSYLNKVEAAPLRLFKHKVVKSELKTSTIRASNLNLKYLK